MLEIFLSCSCPVRCKLSSSGEITQDLDIFRSHHKMLSIICLLSSGNGRNGKYPNNCRFCHISGHFQVRVEFKLWETFAWPSLSTNDYQLSIGATLNLIGHRIESQLTCPCVFLNKSKWKNRRWLRQNKKLRHITWETNIGFTRR